MGGMNNHIKTYRFLSTLSLRRATQTPKPPRRNTPYFYPRSPCGERHNTHTYRVYCPAFLSTLSLRRATSIQRTKKLENVLFLSTLSLRRATGPPRGDSCYLDISIHALLAESDKPMPLIKFFPGTFLSTLSLRRATEFRKLLHPGSTNFYPRSPCGERLISPHSTPDNGNFYPRSPCGERPRS